MSRGVSTVSRLSAVVTAETIARILRRRELERQRARRRRLAFAALLGATAVAGVYLRSTRGDEG